MNDERLAVATESELNNCLAATDTTSNLAARHHNFELLTKIAAAVRHVRIFGSSSLHLARIAESQLDFYYKTHCNYWDIAAGALIVQEAGGVVTDMKGQPLTRATGLARSTTLRTTMVIPHRGSPDRMPHLWMFAGRAAMAIVTCPARNGSKALEY